MRETTMPASAHLIDLIDLPTRQRQIIQLLLRNGTMLESDLRRALGLLTSVPSHRDELEGELSVLATAGWLTRDSDADEARCCLGSLARTRKRLDKVWERLDANDSDHVWQVRMPSAAPAAPRAQKRVGALLDALTADEKPNEGLMQRGGKRTLPNAIWDRLEDESSDEARASDHRHSPAKRDLWAKLSSHTKTDDE
jgi:hypothetical protein